MTTTRTADELSSLTREQLDDLPYGAIKLAKDGTILSYNATEGRIVDRDPARMAGRNFFTEVAPCTDVQDFHGRFLELIEHRTVNRQFDFTFPFDPPMRVAITMLLEQREGVVWVLVDRV